MEEVTLPPRYVGETPRKVRVIMAIRAPRGMMRLFELDYEHRRLIDTQCEAIRAFMAQHKQD